MRTEGAPSSTTSERIATEFDDVLATVEDKQNLLVPEKADQGGGRVAGGQRKLERCGNDGQDKGGIREGREVNEADAVSIIGLSGMSQR